MFNLPDVHCTVNSCHFYQSGDLCRSNAIKVMSEGSREASTEEETCCNTFKPKS
ncbi:MAG: DUF1540 domain-containing protein [Methylocystaceae bacterium]